jgi:hypothetical protein
LAVLAGAACVYGYGGHSWWWFLILFLVPDVSFSGYAFGPRSGAILYNIFHSYVGPVALGVGLCLAGKSTAIPLIWAAHIGLDRFLGYGLKYPSCFGDTHLGKLGAAKKTGV